jgi:hypothetical protein
MLLSGEGIGMKTSTVIGLVTLAGAAGALIYLATRKNRPVQYESSAQQPFYTPWTFSLPQSSGSYIKTGSTQRTPAQNPTSGGNYVMADRQNQAAPAAPSFVDQVVKAFEPKAPVSLLRPESKGSTPTSSYVMADRRGRLVAPPEASTWIDSIIESFAPNKPVSLLRPESRPAAEVKLGAPTFMQTLLAPFTSQPTARPSAISPSRIAIQTPARTQYQTQRPPITNAPGDDSPLDVFKEIVQAIAEPIRKVVEPIESAATVSQGITPSPVTQFEKDVGFVSAFTTSDGKRWLKDYRGAQYLSDEFHGSAKAVADAAARSKRDGKSYSPG